MIAFDEPRFLDLLYGACEDPGLWGEVISQFAVAVGGFNGFMTRLSVVDGKGSILAPAIDASLLQTYNAHFANINPINNVGDPDEFLRKWRPIVLTDEDVILKETLVRSEYYNDFAAPADSHTALMVRLKLVGSTPCVLNVSRSRAAGRYAPEALKRARRLQPHLIRAFALTQRLGDCDALKTDLTAFTHNPDAMIVVGPDGCIVRANPRGERLLRSAALTCRQGRLTVPDAAAARRLRDIIAVATSTDPDIRGGGFMALHNPDHALPLAVDVVPRARWREDVFDARSNSAMVCVRDLESRVPVDATRLKELFGLTMTEAKVALALLINDDMPRSAEALGISLHTVQGHLKRIFDKTGVNRQTALTRLLVRSLEPPDGPLH